VTTTLDPTVTTPGVHAGRLLRAEFTKLRTVRSTVWSLAIMVVVSVGLSALFTWLAVNSWDKAGNGDNQANLVRDPVAYFFGAGFYFGQLAICVLGVLVIASEYSTGMIRSSLLAVPHRLRLFAAKAAAFTAVAFVTGLAITFPLFFIDSSILHSHVVVKISDSGVLRALIGGGLYIAVVGLFALALGAIIRHTAGAITTVIGLVLVIFPLANLLPGSWGKHVNAYLPTNAGTTIMQIHQKSDHILTPWNGFLVFVGWTALLLVIASALLVKRDA